MRRRDRRAVQARRVPFAVLPGHEARHAGGTQSAGCRPRRSPQAPRSERCGRQNELACGADRQGPRPDALQPARQARRPGRRHPSAREPDLPSDQQHHLRLLQRGLDAARHGRLGPRAPRGVEGDRRRRGHHHPQDLPQRRQRRRQDERLGGDAQGSRRQGVLCRAQARRGSERLGARVALRLRQGARVRAQP